MSTIGITGARGYVGRVLAERLAGEGCVLQPVFYFSPMQNVPASETVEHVRADLRNDASWRSFEDAAAIVIADGG
jgi:nucleoside-diphosphate-sugar epimerase